MSFTTEMYAAIEEDLRTKPVFDGKPSAMRLIKYRDCLQVAFAINKQSSLRSIFLSISPDTTVASFPKWKGVNIALAKLPDYGMESLYVALEELQGGSHYIFEIVAEDLRKCIENALDLSSAMRAITAVLLRWKNFFQYDGDVILSEIRQQGLMGELTFLEQAINSKGASAVTNWAGCNDETHDFYFGIHGVEIKTTSLKEPYGVHISSEYQLDATDVQGELFLGFYAFRKSQSAGIVLPTMVERVRNLVSSAPAMLDLLNEKLREYGYYDEVKELYTVGYYKRDEYFFRVEDGFPALVPKMLQTGISKVEYALGIDQCMKYQVSTEEIESIL